MLAPHRIQPNNTNKRKKELSITNFDKTHLEHELKTPQKTSNDLAKHDTNTESTVKPTSDKRKNDIPKGGPVHENIGINDDYLD